MRHLFKILFALSILISWEAFGQDEHFHEFSIEKDFIENEEWELKSEATWKRIYDEVSWRRLGISLVGVRKIEKIRLLAGINGYHTFNPKFSNFYELRPWIAIELKLSIIETVNLRQRLKAERRFFYEEVQSTRVDYGRLRYQIGFEMALSKKDEHSLKIRLAFEWFYIRNPAAFERFPNERDYSLLLIKSLSNDHEISFGYKIEEFNNSIIDRGNGHIFSAGYSF